MALGIRDRCSSCAVKYSLPAHVQNAVLTVRDQLGRLLYQKELDASSGELRIPGDELATGVHYASLRSEDGGIRKVKKLVKIE